MKVVVMGATGLTGREVVRLAHERGHQVIAAGRSAADMPWPEDVEPLALDVVTASQVAGALHGADAAVVTVGIGSSRAPTMVYSAGIANVLAGLSASGGRVSVVSALPAGPRNVLPRSQRLLARVLDRFFGSTYEDMRRMEAILRGSDLDWTCLRPPRLVNKVNQAGYRLSAQPLGGSVSRTGLAAACLDVLDDVERRRCFLYISS